MTVELSVMCGIEVKDFGFFCRLIQQGLEMTCMYWPSKTRTIRDTLKKPVT